MIVVSDTTPLISLLKTGRLDTLEKLFGEVRIPDAVFEELTSNPRYSDEAVSIRSFPYIDIISVSDTDAVEQVSREDGLDLGESEAIVLTQEISADLLLHRKYEMPQNILTPFLSQYTRYSHIRNL